MKNQWGKIPLVFQLTQEFSGLIDFSFKSFFNWGLFFLADKM